MGSYPPPSDGSAHPEILPPDGDGGGVEQPGVSGQEAGAGSHSWAYAPATYVLVGINCLVFVVMLLFHVSIWRPTTLQLYMFGATDPIAVLVSDQWWRIVTATFVHVGIIHLATNMWCLWNLGLLGEPLIGPFGIMAAYVLSGAAGNLLSTGILALYGERVVGAGASGAVFGIAGVLIVLLKSPRLSIPAKERSGLRNYVIYFAAISFVIGFGTNQLSDHFTLGVSVDNMAHLGGFLAGIVFALPMVPLMGSSKELFYLRRRVAVGLTTGLLVLFGFFISTVFPASALQVR